MLTSPRVQIALLRTGTPEKRMCIKTKRDAPRYPPETKTRLEHAQKLGFNGAISWAIVGVRTVGGCTYRKSNEQILVNALKHINDAHWHVSMNPFNCCFCKGTKVI